MPPRNPIVIAYHLVWTAYGTWLPNDPRGSGSRAVAARALADLGELHFGRRPVQPSPRVVREFHRRAEPRLAYRVIHFDEQQIEIIATAFAEQIRAQDYTCYACAILSDHAHLVIRKHKHRAEAMIENLQRASRLRLSREVEIPPDHPVWTEGGWKSFLDSPDAMHAAVRYVQRNPIKAGLPAQSWNFVTPYEGWPFRSRSPLVD